MLHRTAGAQLRGCLLVHFDAHLDTWDTYFGAPFTHGTPFRRASEEGLFIDDASLHVGIRGPLYSRDDLERDRELGFRVIHCDEFQTQGVDAIAISANDPDAVVPALKKAMDRGITVISWDSGVAEGGRQMHLNPSSTELIGNTIIKLAADHMPDGGDIAILSASATATNQNAWIEAAEGFLPDYEGVNLVATVYGDDLSDKSYREAQGLMASYPDLKAIIAPTTVGILASCQAVTDAGKIGEINVTGLGLPSEMAGCVDSGATKSFAIWNPIDLGYSATMLAHAIASGSETAPGAEIPMGRMGSVTLDDTNSAAMSDPFTYDSSNIEQFKSIF